VRPQLEPNGRWRESFENHRVRFNIVNKHIVKCIFNVCSETLFVGNNLISTDLSASAAVFGVNVQPATSADPPVRETAGGLCHPGPGLQGPRPSGLDHAQGSRSVGRPRGTDVPADGDRVIQDASRTRGEEVRIIKF